MQSNDGMSIVFALDEADVLDSDGDRLGDTLEEALGTSPTSEDSDDNGVSDRDQIEQEAGS